MSIWWHLKYVFCVLCWETLLTTTHIRTVPFLFFLLFFSFDCRQNLCRVPGALPVFHSIVKLRLLWSTGWSCLSNARNQLSFLLLWLVNPYVSASSALRKCYYLSCITPWSKVVFLSLSAHAFNLHPQNHFKYTLFWVPFHKITNHMFLIFMWLKLT